MFSRSRILRVISCRPLEPKRPLDVLRVAGLRIFRWWLVVCAIGAVIQAHTVAELTIQYGP